MAGMEKDILSMKEPVFAVRPAWYSGLMKKFMNSATRWKFTRYRSAIAGSYEVLSNRPSGDLSEATCRDHGHGSGEPQWRGERCFFRGYSEGKERDSADHAFRSVRNSGADRRRSPGLRRTGLGGKAGAQTCVARIAAGAGGSDRSTATAGIDAASLPLEEKRRFGVILGSGGGSQEFTEEQYRLFFHQQYKQMSLFCVPTGVMGTLSSELSVRFGLRGPSHVVTTGCTSSTDGFGYSVRQIQSGRLDMALSGGADAPISLGIVKGFILMKILTDSWNHAPERGSRPFSVDRDGFVVAEGAWMFVLEEYEHARARGAKILAEICRLRLDLRGVSIGCGLQECGEEPARAIGLAMKEAGIGANDVHYVNLHGTSTQLNDRIETRALKLVLGEHAAQVPMSALKSQIGHPQGACGAAGVAATIVAMQNGQIPPTINLETRDPECDLDYVPDVGTEEGDRARGVQLHRVWIEEFGAGVEELCVKQSSVVSRRSSANPSRTNRGRASRPIFTPAKRGPGRRPTTDDQRLLYDSSKCSTVPSTLGQALERGSIRSVCPAVEISR